MRHTDGLKALKIQADKFWANVDRSDLFGCWIWTGPIDPGNGYGRPGRGNRKVYAHRVSYEMHHGPIPPGSNVLHRCNQKLCVHPLHTYLGDQLANAADAKAAGVIGKRLNAETAREIFRLRHEGGWSYLGLAEKFSVSPQCIANVCRRRTWGKATDDLVHLVKPKTPKKPGGKKPALPRKPSVRKPKRVRASSEMVMQ